MKIAIAGAGAIGSKFGWRLKKARNNVTLIDGWDKNIAAVRKNGVIAKINGKEMTQKMPIYSPAEIDEKKENVDLLIVFTKSMQLESMLNSLKPIISQDTYVLCLLNGLCHEEVLGKFVKKDHTLTLAVKKKPKKSLKFDDAGLNARYSENVMYSIWRKACVNGVANALCALLGCNMKEFGSSKQADGITRNIIQEFADVAQYEGINLDRQEVINHVEGSFKMSHYLSMYQDLEQNHRPTEIDYIDGAVWRKGLKHSVPTPYCAFVTQLIHAKEDIMGVK